MKVLAISGSARKQGNTALLLQAVCKELQKEGIETDLVELAAAAVEPCKACFACGDKENCVHGKDEFASIFDKMKDADGLILGSPVYSANISAKMQALLERAAVVCDMNPGLMKHKVGVAVASVRRGGSLQAIDAMNHFFLNHEMFVAGSTYWNMAYGQMPGDVSQDEEGMQNMKNLGQNMAFLLKAVAERR
ncbi:MAG: flavodoxin family protein [Selenomonas sp.]|nr:flavodoxin family protein [Selenomonas sp.]